MADSSRPLSLFYCYAHEDGMYLKELDEHLSLLKRRLGLVTWWDEKILPGEVWGELIKEHLMQARIVVFLVSAYFLHSDYCYEKEMPLALQQHELGKTQVIPVIVRHVDWKGAPFSHLQMIPDGARPVTDWPNRHRAWQGVASKIRKVLESLIVPSPPPADSLQGTLAKGPEKPRRSSKKKITFDHLRIDALMERGNGLESLGKYEEALEQYEEILRLDPQCAAAYLGQGEALNACKQYEAALLAYGAALRLDPASGAAYVGTGQALSGLGRHNEALAAYEKALLLNPLDLDAAIGKRELLRRPG